MSEPVRGGRRVRARSELETQAFAGRLAHAALGGEVAALKGDMGAGKTAFARGFAAALGAEASSPTFTIVHEYDTLPRVYHFDLYRINSLRELHDIGYEEYFDGQAVVLIEWPPDDMEKDYLEVTLEPAGGEAREIIFRPNGMCAEAWLQRSGI